VSEHTEEARALLQKRVALFWKVMFFLSVLSSGLGALGAIAKPGGAEVAVVLAQTAQTGLFWRLCARGERSIRFSRLMESGGLLLNLSAGAFMGRYVIREFTLDHALVTAEGGMMTDAYITMLHVAGLGLLLAIRAALIPSSPRRTLGVTAVVGIPLVVSTFFVVADGRLVWRALGASAYPWLPTTAAMLWGYVLITCVVISRVIYGLRAEVREARRLGQYVLEEKIGEGGMGEVYRARHGMMRRPSALKLMRGDSAGASSALRFEREVQLTARLTHPNTITIFDYGRTDDGIFYYAMELLDGATLQRIVAVDGAQPAGRVVRVLAMACGALTEAHGIGLIHRDIKPANMMLCMQGGVRDVVKLLDFGLVKELEVTGDVKLTGASTLTGTPQYMAPESVLDPDSADARADIYALGAVAYYLLAGTDVFTGSSIVEVCSKHLHQVPEPFSARGVVVPPDLEALVLACLEKKPERRPSSAAELRRRLEACAVDPWDSAAADAWWADHKIALENDAARNRAEPRTIAIAPSRASTDSLA
jgi:serine/threonine-protein kinase